MRKNDHYPKSFLTVPLVWDEKLFNLILRFEDKKLAKLVRTLKDIHSPNNNPKSPPELPLGGTLMHYVCQYDLEQTFQTLCKLNARLDIKNKEGKTPLDFAQPQHLEFFEQEQIKKEEDKIFNLAYLENNMGSGAKVIAAVKRGGNPNSKSLYGMPVLHVFCEKRLTHIKTLIEMGADVNLTDGLGKISLHAALGQITAPAQNSLVKYLLKMGANVNHQDKTGYTPFHMVVYYRPELIPKFLKKGADPYLACHDKDPQNKTRDAFYFAARNPRALAILEYYLLKLRSPVKEHLTLKNKTLL